MRGPQHYGGTESPKAAALALALRPGVLSIHAHSWQNHYHGTKSKLPPTGNFQKDMLLSSTEIHSTSVNRGKTKKYLTTSGVSVVSLIFLFLCVNVAVFF